MKKTATKTLSILLAALMLLGVGGTAGAAADATADAGSATLTTTQATPPPLMKGAQKSFAPQAAPQDAEDDANGTVTIQTAGTASGEIYFYSDGYANLETIDLSGLVIQAKGGQLKQEETVEYDTATGEGDSPALGKLTWTFGVRLDWDKQPDGWKLGDNEARLIVNGLEYTNFTLVKTENGIEYGTFEQERVFYGETPITLHCTEPSSRWMSYPRQPLLLNTAVEVQVSDTETVFEFQPDESGYYEFRSSGGQNGQTLYPKDGEGDPLTMPYIDPQGQLHDEKGRYLAYSDDSYSDGEGTLDFCIGYHLEKDKTYYLRTAAWGDGKYTVKVTKEADRVLKVKSNEIRIAYHDEIELLQAGILEGTTWDMDVLRFSYDAEKLNVYYWYWWYESPGEFYVAGKERGAHDLTITAPDGSHVTITVRVKYSFAQWMCVIFLGGWAWMKYTDYGKFSLQKNIADLLYYGVGNGLYDLLTDWGVPSRWVSWMRKD
ncbi:MAG: hypothetical protein LBG83_00720 [Oscillospiraceae bacterium]|jgi:hypothetical protein|nr:hypothetical protein [Oscillospiraceae bacterium]